MPTCLRIDAGHSAYFSRPDERTARILAAGGNADTMPLLSLAEGTGVFKPHEIQALREVLDDYHASNQELGHRCVTAIDDGLRPRRHGDEIPKQRFDDNQSQSERLAIAPAGAMFRQCGGSFEPTKDVLARRRLQQ